MQASTNINVRAAPHVRDLIDRAASLVNKTRTDFILEASCNAANQVLLDQVLFRVTGEQMAEFEKLMTEPVTMNAAVKKLLAKRSPWEA
ncbi:MAG: hypothetical protein RLZZ618_4043 [Pseudomonadota bacterium]|jgi:uncharacterized protein (DUF1778 family)